ncbi:MAG: hypothetical protein ACKVHR_15500 [Pirellulales bacterium]|jgi:hypothetical protein
MHKYRSQLKVVNRLFRDVDGYNIAETDDGRVASQRAAVYGELTPRGVQRLLSYLQLTEDDVFYDLGSGVGKVVLQVGMAVPVRKCVGIEMVQSRCRAAQRVLRAAQSEGLIQSNRTLFRKGSFLDSNLSDATVIYLCSTCYSSHLMKMIVRKIKEIKKPLTVVTLREFDRKHRGFQFLRTIKLDASWSANVEAYVYKILP